MNLALYRDLFVHRADVFAEQQSNGNYRPVGKGHWDDDADAFVYDRYFVLDDDFLNEHLEGAASYGVYCVDPRPLEVVAVHDAATGPEYYAGPANTVRYVVFDLDTYTPEGFDKLVRTCTHFILATTGGSQSDLTCLLAENSGGKGFHVWLFLDEPLPAAQVRAWVRDGFEPMWKTEVGAFTSMLPLEIFPKQDEVEPGGFGNLVKLPLGVHAKSGNRSTFVPVQGWASDVDTATRLSASLVPAYVPPTSTAETERTQGSGLRTDEDLTPFRCISKVLLEGAPSGTRDNAMFHLAAYMRGTGLPEDMALDWCMRANAQFDPPLRDREVRTKVKSAYKGPAPQASCSADWLEGFCPGGPHCFAPWNEDRPKKGRDVEADIGGSYLTLDREARKAARERRRGKS